MTAFDEKYKDKVAKELALRIAEGLIKEEIKLAESRKIALYILEQSKAASNHSQLIGFLEKLMQLYD